MRYGVWVDDGQGFGGQMVGSDDLEILLKTCDSLDKQKSRWLLIDNLDDSTVKMSNYHKQVIEVMGGKRKEGQLDPEYQKLFGVRSDV